MGKLDELIRGGVRMRSKTRDATLFRCVILMFCIAAAATTSQAQLAYRGTSNAPAQQVRIAQKLDQQLPLELTFQNSAGERVKLGQLIGSRPVILNLVYYECPMLCNLAMDGLVRSLRALKFDAGNEFTVITVSFDPREKPPLAKAARRTALRRYGRAGAEKDWHFLTGDNAAIERLTDAVGFEYRWDEKTGQYAHAAGLIVLTPEGRTSRYLLGVEFAPRDLRLALVEASQNRIGSVTDQVLLLCYQYDPTTGKYGLLIQRVLRLAGVSTVLALGGVIGLLLLRERQQRRRDPASETD